MYRVNCTTVCTMVVLYLSMYRSSVCTAVQISKRPEHPHPKTKEFALFARTLQAKAFSSRAKKEGFIVMEPRSSREFSNLARWFSSPRLWAREESFAVASQQHTSAIPPAQPSNLNSTQSSFQGVSFNKKKGKWIACICVNGTNQHIAVTSSEYEAAVRYDEVAARLGRPLNFPGAGQQKAEKKQKLAKADGTMSHFKGVVWRRAKGNFQSRIKVDGKWKCLGSFSKEEDAARAYDSAARLYGRALNFPALGGLDGNNKPAQQESVSPSEAFPGEKVSAYTGVSWDKREQKWHAQIRSQDGRKLNLGRFSSEITAAQKYDEAAAAQNKPVNFPTAPGQTKAVKRSQQKPAKPRATNVRPQSVFKGVVWGVSEHAWVAKIVTGGRCQVLGTFKSDADAARAYDAHAAPLGRLTNFASPLPSQPHPPPSSPPLVLPLPPLLQPMLPPPQPPLQPPPQLPLQPPLQPPPQPPPTMLPPFAPSLTPAILEDSISVSAQPQLQAHRNSLDISSAALTTIPSRQRSGLKSGSPKSKARPVSVAFSSAAKDSNPRKKEKRSRSPVTTVQPNTDSLASHSAMFAAPLESCLKFFGGRGSADV